jgi:hypothetical protein
MEQAARPEFSKAPFMITPPDRIHHQNALSRCGGVLQAVFAAQQR